jgi:DNA-nicking Smr family endonuclease
MNEPLDDTTMFRELMNGVEPLRGETVVSLKRAADITPGQLMRRQAAQSREDRYSNFLSITDIPPVDPHGELSFKRPGVQHGVFRRLRLGEYRFDSRLDLHGLGVEQAREALFAFIRDCLKHEVRSALISHGKGLGRKPPALLKSCVAFWLPQFEEVLAFHSAPRHLGGMGATAVLLRKSEKARLETFEIHSKRRR